MTIVECAEDFPVSTGEAQRLWLDVERWGEFVEGFASVRHLDPRWPEKESLVVWVSTPHGRGQVSERVCEFEPGASVLSQITDDRLQGARTVSFHSGGDASEAVRVTVSFDYRLKGPLWRRLAIDWLFVRRALRDSIWRELERFGYALEVG